ncbi:hypothetical protein C8R46DRAFT_1173029 [Mycena filopes]|nr:hypothetical protein C8R46DRAFT_1173029 [Mycena filopes]
MTELVLVTGASGFLGSHVVLQLIEKGYRVRAAARGSHVEHMRATYATYDDQVQVIEIADTVDGTFLEAFIGVSSVIHTASPLPGRVEPAEMLKRVEAGELNVLVQAEKAGVKNVVVTSSIGTVVNPKYSFTDQDWNPITKETALTCGNPLFTYAAAKKFAELALWEWAEAHPHVEVTTPNNSTVNPTYLFGPFTPHVSIPKPSFPALSTNVLIYNYLFPSGVFPPQSLHVDVRDVAAAHVAALRAPPTASVGRKRLLISSPHGQPFADTVAFIATQRPALKERLITIAPAAQPIDKLPLDFARLESVLGMKVSDFHTLEETILDTVDALVRVEDGWKKAGFEIQTPPPFV